MAKEPDEDKQIMIVSMSILTSEIIQLLAKVDELRGKVICGYPELSLPSLKPLEKQFDIAKKGMGRYNISRRRR